MSLNNRCGILPRDGVSDFGQYGMEKGNAQMLKDAGRTAR
jgi:hypothetical protein